MHIKLETLRTFVVVADCGTLLDASETLGRTPSAISMALKQLSEQLSVELFETDRKSRLTPVGRFVLEEGRRALNDFDDSMSTIQRYAHGNIGTVRVAVVPSIAKRLLPEIVRCFQAGSPNVRLELRDIDSALVADSVRNGNVDFGVASLPSTSHDLSAELLLEEPFGFVCYKGHDLAESKQPLAWQDIVEQPFISNGLCSQIKHPMASYMSSNAKIKVHNIATLISFIRQAMGATLLPKMAIEGEDDLCFLPLADNTALRQLYFLQHRNHRLSPAALAFKHEIIQASAGKAERQISDKVE